MENYVYLVCLFAIPGCLANNVPSGTWLGDMKGVADIDASIERPCPGFDLKCIRQYFANYSHCKPANGRIADPFIVPRMVIPLPSPNITMISYDTKTSGLNGKITEFYINPKTNNLVIAVEMRNVSIASPKRTFIYYRLRKEPIVLTDDMFIKYDAITLTGVFPDMKNLELSELEVFSYINNSNPPYGIGPGIIKTYDMDAIRSFNALFQNGPLAIIESFIVRGPSFIREFIQRTLCDFRL